MKKIFAFVFFALLIPSFTFAQTATCKDGTYSYSAHRSGTCSHHGGVSVWTNTPIRTYNSDYYACAGTIDTYNSRNGTSYSYYYDTLKKACTYYQYTSPTHFTIGQGMPYTPDVQITCFDDHVQDTTCIDKIGRYEFFITPSQGINFWNYYIADKFK